MGKIKSPIESIAGFNELQSDYKSNLMFLLQSILVLLIFNSK